MRWARYLWRAFNARPWGMPIPPLWFGLAAFALLGYFVSPAFYLLGAGGTLVLSGLIASNGRFQRAVDAVNQPPPPDDKAEMRNRLDERSKERLHFSEAQVRARSTHEPGVVPLKHRQKHRTQRIMSLRLCRGHCRQRKRRKKLKCEAHNASRLLPL